MSARVRRKKRSTPGAGSGAGSRRAAQLGLVVLVAAAAAVAASLLVVRRSEANVDVVVVARSVDWESAGLGRLRLGSIKGFDKIQTSADTAIQPARGSACPVPAGARAVMLRVPSSQGPIPGVSLGSLDFRPGDRLRLNMEDDVWTLGVSRTSSRPGEPAALVRASLQVRDGAAVDVLTNPPADGGPCALRAGAIELSRPAALSLHIAPAGGNLSGELTEERLPIQGPIRFSETTEREIAGTPLRRAIPTVVRGEVTLLDAGAKKIALSPREELAIRVGHGDLVSLEGLADGYSLRLQATVTELAVGSPARNLLPSWLEYLHANNPLRLYWGALAFLVGIGMTAYKALFKRSDA